MDRFALSFASEIFPKLEVNHLISLRQIYIYFFI